MSSRYCWWERLRRKSTGSLLGRRPPTLRLGDRRQRGQAQARLGDPALRLLGAARLGHAEHVGALLDVVEGDQAVGEDEGRVGHRATGGAALPSQSAFSS